MCTEKDSVVDKVEFAVYGSGPPDRDRRVYRINDPPSLTPSFTSKRGYCCETPCTSILVHSENDQWYLKSVGGSILSLAWIKRVILDTVAIYKYAVRMAAFARDALCLHEPESFHRAAPGTH